VHVSADANSQCKIWMDRCMANHPGK